MERAAVDADVIDRLIAHERDQLRHDVLLPALDEQPLRVQAPEHVVGGERARAARPDPLFDSDRFFAARRALVDDAVDAAAQVIAHRRLVRRALADAESLPASDCAAR